MLTVSSQGGAGGVVTSETEGGLSRSYDVSRGGDLAATSYGRELESLRRSVIVGPMTSAGDVVPEVDGWPA